MLLALRLIHIFAAAFLVGAAIFNYCLLRPALRLIPPAHGMVLTRKLGTLTTYLGWTALGLLFVSGFLRLYLRAELEVFLSLDLFTQSHLRALALMTFAWLVILVISFVMTFILRSRLAKSSAVVVAAGDKKKMTQAEACRRLDLLQLLIVIMSSLALLAGASMVDGGLF
jgi:uncharacterized membrane protein